MPTTDWSGAPIPSAATADDVPVTIASLTDVYDPLLNLQAVDFADRDTRYGLLPKGSVVIVSSPMSAWIKADSATPTWDDLLYDTGWITAGFANAGGWSISTAKIRKRGGDIELRANMTRTGADLVPGTGTHEGNITDTNVLVIPSGYWPTDLIPVQSFSSFGVTTCCLTGSGIVQILALANGGMTLATGDVLTIGGRWLDG